MSAQAATILATVGILLLAGLGVFAVISRGATGRGPSRDRPGPDPVSGRVPPTTLAAEPPAAGLEKEGPVSTRVEEPHSPSWVTIVTKKRLIETPPDEVGVTRRQFFNRAAFGTFSAFLAILGLDFLAFLWPRLSGGFGAVVNAGDVTSLLDQAFNDDGSVSPVFIPEARAYVVPAPHPIPNVYTGKGVATNGVFALYQRCVHLGCRVPWCASSQGFECPCHGSKYSQIGEYFAGPAPRSLDRFAVQVTDAGELLIDTGRIVQTPRLPTLNVPYPQGPSCIE